MTRLFACLLLTLVAACSSTSIASVDIALTAAEKDAKVYVEKPACPQPGTLSLSCSDAATIAKIKAADNVANNALAAARGGTGSASAAMAAVAGLTALIPTK